MIGSVHGRNRIGLGWALLAVLGAWIDGGMGFWDGWVVVLYGKMVSMYLRIIYFTCWLLVAGRIWYLFM